MNQLSEAQHLKFGLLGQGLVIAETAATALRDMIGDKTLSPNDYASTSGVILRLEDDVWVNAPIELYNPNFVSATPYRLDYDDGFYVDGAGLTSRAEFWPQPTYHGTVDANGPLNNYVVTHGDRGRLSPVRSCSMTCTFCNIPYDDPLSVYSLKPLEALLAAADAAVNDPVQPAQHLLISGGTPKPKDIPRMRAFYEAVLQALPGVQVDIMMVPLPGLFDLPTLDAMGLHELSINIELFSRERARDYTRSKYNQGLDFYLNFIELASSQLGPGRARSMLMVGLEPMEDTLAGVRAIAQRGGTPVLSPFRPDPVTPLRDIRPPTTDYLIETYLRALDVLAEVGGVLGPDCPPCTHNTLNFATDAVGEVSYPHELPRMLGRSV